MQSRNSSNERFLMSRNSGAQLTNMTVANRWHAGRHVQRFFASFVLLFVAGFARAEYREQWLSPAELKQEAQKHPATTPRSSQPLRRSEAREKRTVQRVRRGERAASATDPIAAFTRDTR